jgi:hypothetical protein
LRRAPFASVAPAAAHFSLSELHQLRFDPRITRARFGEVSARKCCNSSRTGYLRKKNFDGGKLVEHAPSLCFDDVSVRGTMVLSLSTTMQHA